MSFFKKIKDKLFTLNIDDKEPVLEEKPKKVKSKEKSISKPVKEDSAQKSKAKNKFEKKVASEKKSKAKNENRVNKYVAGLKKSAFSFSRAIKELQSRHNKIDENFFEELEEALILSDISIDLVDSIIDEVRKEVKLENVTDPKLITEILIDKMFTIYTNQSLVNTNLNIKKDRKNIIIVSGVNGVGKTTSIAKIANRYVKDGFKVLIAAADTFRAGAVEQLAIWAKKIKADIVKPIKENADPSSVVYEALDKMLDEKYNLLIIDTAGRLQNKVNLMNELAKINQVIQKKVPDAPHESLLVIDATTGQNGVLQAQSFKDVTNLSGIVLTKMDGTSKGGIILTIKDKLNLPVKLVGLGESLDDLQDFDLETFIYGLTKEFIDGYSDER